MEHGGGRLHELLSFVTRHPGSITREVSSPSKTVPACEARFSNGGYMKRRPRAAYEIEDWYPAGATTYPKQEVTELNEEGRVEFNSSLSFGWIEVVA